ISATGAVLSTLRATLVNVAWLPALSTTTTWPVTFAPSVLSTSGLATLVEARPESASPRVNAMLTLVLFHPLVFGTGEGVPKLSTGGVASRLMVTELLEVPAPEATAQLNVIPAVSVVTVLSLQPLFDRMLSDAFTTCQDTCTSLVYQPLLPVVPLTT